MFYLSSLQFKSKSFEHWHVPCILESVSFLCIQHDALNIPSYAYILFVHGFYHYGNSVFTASAIFHSQCLQVFLKIWNLQTVLLNLNKAGRNSTQEFEKISAYRRMRMNHVILSGNSGYFQPTFICKYFWKHTQTVQLQFTIIG